MMEQQRVSEALDVNALLYKADRRTHSPSMFQNEWAVGAEKA
jgi:hypothetical protein